MLVVAFALLTGLPSPASALVIEWDANGANPPNGIFGVANNWNLGQVPGVGDIVTFNLVDTYTVTFDSNATSDLLNVTAGDVTFVSDSATVRTYLISSGAADAFINGGNLTTGQSGNPVSLRLNDPFTSVLRIGNGADGSVNVVGTGSALSTGVFVAQKIGDNGASGSLTISEGATATIQSNPGLQVAVSANDNTTGSILVDTGGILNVLNLQMDLNTDE